AVRRGDGLHASIRPLGAIPWNGRPMAEGFATVHPLLSQSGRPESFGWVIDMLSWLVSTSVRLRVVLLAACVVLLIAGYRSAVRAPLDVFPEFAPPLVEIQTEAPGLSSEQVESLVTIPLENVLTGIPNVKAVRSKSVLGLSQVVLVLGHGTDYMKVRQLVQERVAVEATR